MNGRLAALTFLLLLAAPGGPALAFTCPLEIKRAEELIARAEQGTPTPEARALLEEARRLVAEARAHHEGARSPKDHADAVRKARTAQTLAQEAGPRKE
jgi:hypothetical protein